MNPTTFFAARNQRTALIFAATGFIAQRKLSAADVEPDQPEG